MLPLTIIIRVYDGHQDEPVCCYRYNSANYGVHVVVAKLPNEVYQVTHKIAARSFLQSVMM